MQFFFLNGFSNRAGESGFLYNELQKKKYPNKPFNSLLIVGNFLPKTYFENCLDQFHIKFRPGHEIENVLSLYTSL